MPPKDDSKTMFTFDTVAVLVAALNEKGATISNADYERMAALDGTRSAYAFQHQFRAVKAKAKELNGVEATSKKSTKKVASDDSEKNKGGKRSRAKKGDEEAGNEAGDGDDDEATSSKKVKAEPREEDSLG